MDSDSEVTRYCSKCQEHKPRSVFGGGSSYCRPCQAAYQRSRYAARLAADPQGMRAYQRERCARWRDQHREEYNRYSTRYHTRRLMETTSERLEIPDFLFPALEQVRSSGTVNMMGQGDVLDQLAERCEMDSVEWLILHYREWPRILTLFGEWRAAQPEASDG